MPTGDLLSAVVAADNLISPGAVADRLQVTRLELASFLGLSRDAVSKSARAERGARSAMRGHTKMAAGRSA